MQTLPRVAAGILIAAIIGFVLARSGGKGGSSPSPSALSRHASAAHFRVSYPGNWRTAAAVPGGLLPQLAHRVALAPSGKGREMVIGDAASTALPAALVSALPRKPASEVVTLGGQRYIRYLDLAPRGQGITEAVYLLPTTEGAIGAVCASQSASAAFTSSCEKVLSTLRLTSGTAVSPGAQTSYALSVNGILSPLNSVRRTDGAALRGANLHTRARAAQQLATAHAGAASAIRQLPVQGRDLAAANRALVAALNDLASGYRSLGDAISARSTKRYAAAQTTIAAGNRELEAAFVQLRRLGYHISTSS